MTNEEATLEMQDVEMQKQSPVKVPAFASHWPYSCVVLATVLCVLPLMPLRTEIGISPAESLKAEGCQIQHYVHFGALVLLMAVTGVAGAFVFSRAAGSWHMKSCAGYIFLQWLQALDSLFMAALKARFDNCSYGFAPVSGVDPELSFSFLSRPLMMLVGFFWVQQLVTDRMAALAAASGRSFSAKCLQCVLMIGRLALVVAAGVFAAVVVAGVDFRSFCVVAGDDFRYVCVHEEYSFVVLVSLLPFMVSALASFVAIMWKMSQLLCSLGRAGRTARKQLAPPGVCSQFDRAYWTTVWQTLGTGLSFLMSFASVIFFTPFTTPLVDLEDSGNTFFLYVIFSEWLWILDILTNVVVAVLLSGVHRLAERQPRTHCFQLCSGKKFRRSAEPKDDCDPQWQGKIEALAGRGIALHDILEFYKSLGRECMLHYQPEVHTTSDVVRQAIIPQTSGHRSAYASMVNAGKQVQPMNMVTHNWGNLFCDLVASIIADALDEYSFDLISKLLVHDISILEQQLIQLGRMSRTYWICAFSVNQHASICGGNPHGDVDSVTRELHPVCGCNLPKFFNSTPPLSLRGQSVGCEMNKFDDMMNFLASTDKHFQQVVAVDVGFSLFGRAWCVAELAEARRLGICQSLKLKSARVLQEHAEELRCLQVEQMKASRPEDVADILAKIPDVAAFNSALQQLIFDKDSGLLAAWDGVDTARRMSEAGHLLKWSMADPNQASLVWKFWDA